MIDRDEVVQELRYALGNRQDAAARMLSTLDFVQVHKLERAPELPWFLLSDDTYQDTVSGQEYLTVPTDFLREHEDGALWNVGLASKYDSTDVDWKGMGKDTHNVLRDFYRDNTDTDDSCHYSLDGDKWRLADVPDAAYRIFYKYYQKQTVPSALAGGSSTNAWITNAGDLLVAEAAKHLGNQLQFRRAELASLNDLVKEAWYRYNTDQIARQMQGRRLVMGEI